MKKSRRVGAPETSSVSAVPQRKRTARALADKGVAPRDVSTFVAGVAADAKRRRAAGAFLCRHQISAPSRVEADALERKIARELATWKKRVTRSIRHR